MANSRASMAGPRKGRADVGDEGGECGKGAPGEGGGHVGDEQADGGEHALDDGDADNAVEIGLDGVFHDGKEVIGILGREGEEADKGAAQGGAIAEEEEEHDGSDEEINEGRASVDGHGGEPTETLLHCGFGAGADLAHERVFGDV